MVIMNWDLLLLLGYVYIFIGGFRLSYLFLLRNCFGLCDLGWMIDKIG